METARQIPKWIWHPEREHAGVVQLTRSFRLETPVTNTALYIALTGAAEIKLDGEPVGGLDEDARNVCAFHKVNLFPRKLEAGEHILTIRLECSSPMPVGPINIHLNKRRVGCIAYLEGEGLWLTTDHAWMVSEDTSAEVICLLGEEPFGDLERGPAWFVAGGYGDIAVAPLEETRVLSASSGNAVGDGSFVHICGDGAGEFVIPEPERKELAIFYHVRKQQEWARMNEYLTSTKLHDMPAYLLDLGKEYNMRFWLENRSDIPVTIVWNGAESLPELERYTGQITESFRLEPGRSEVSLPQGVRYLRIYVLAAKNRRFSLVWRGEEALVPLAQKGFLSTDSEMLQQIFDTSLHTNRVCHQLGLWDGIKRDRLNWTYDFYLAAKADYVLWEDFSVLRRSIEELGRGTPEGYWMNAIPSYTLWWINNVWEYFLHTGDREFVLSLEKDLLRHCSQVQNHQDPETGLLRNVSASLIEWVPMNTEEAELAMQALLRMTADNLRKLKQYLPELMVPDWKVPQVEGHLFLSGEQLITKLLGIIAGYVDKQAAEAFLRDYQAEDPITPLSAYWLADCCSAIGLHDKAWEAISAVWGKMLEEGATTFWEGVKFKFDTDYHDALTTYTAYDSYRMSLCHSWASTPVHWIMARVIGIQPAEPGYRRIRLQPGSIQAIQGATVCMARIPTPFGTIEAGWEGSEGEAFILRLPEGIRMIENA